jgi:uncharacterized protein
MEIENHWDEIRKLFDEAYKSCFHFSVATINSDGSPHITPIGGLFLKEGCNGFYFEEFLVNLPGNLDNDARICVMAVNADKVFWGKSLLDGRFAAIPAIRLTGTAGKQREASEDEIVLFQKRIGIARNTKGYKIMWENMHRVRDIKFDACQPIHLADMTAGLI